MDATLTKVFIWDMDETLILLKSLLNGTFAQSFNDLKDADKGVQIGRMWENHILNVCDECFFYEQIENNNTPFLDALKQYDDGRDLSDYEFDRDGLCPPFDDLSLKKIAYRHRAIAHKYKEQGSYWSSVQVGRKSQLLLLVWPVLILPIQNPSM
ncbi:hypothetical protein CISIN_1g022279mg [Citrus sinensis]|uniref:protein-tyrosine-phosphatase n=1 Tax=Citrus sinensis TaxID=2711 RepID=A0A067E7G8_CITSI|nr:hypothetical protein CISIN_1g022279mg [Citrus sinensis]